MIVHLSAWPLDYVAGKKYPLVIQTHAWSPDRFWIDGPWTTGFAAQSLAGKGFFVLQLPDPDDPHASETPKEVPAAMAIYDGAIDLLERKGLIDRDRVGITGFSRTYWYVTYTLIYSKHHFAAAAVADGVDYSYFQYMLYSNFDQTQAGSFDLTNGVPPFGKGLLKWLKVSPAFLMDKIETPLRIQALYPASLLFDWHWFSGLTRLGKPVEMIYLPEGTHVLEKPWDRMISQQGNVDWFSFFGCRGRRILIRQKPTSTRAGANFGSFEIITSNSAMPFPEFSVQAICCSQQMDEL